MEWKHEAVRTGGMMSLKWLSLFRGKAMSSASGSVDADVTNFDPDIYP